MIRIVSEIHFDSPPVMLAAWPGMGNVGLIAMDYLRRKLHARPFAEIDMTPFFNPDSIVVKQGLAQLPKMPTSVFHYVHNPNLIIFESDAQASGHDAILITKTILDAAQQYHVKRIYTAAAFTQSISYRSPSEVLVATTSKSLLAEMEGEQITPMPDGYIAGLNGLVLGVADTRSIPAACFLGTLPSYATNITYPKASLEIIRVLSRLLSTEVETAEIEDAVAQMDNQLARVEDRIREIFPAMEEQDEQIKELGQDKVPDHVMERIEQLFQIVEKDHSRAPELKSELDRWNLYELYENRFLDIFDEDKNKD
ncbi:MAG: hypothetical protein GF331_07150 [Chitinivibrionales bacterium]|nr:hypothetical protein [Chitinivibrionales bacterium]